MHGTIFTVKGEARLFLETVSPGDYWIRIRHPGYVIKRSSIEMEILYRQKD